MNAAHLTIITLIAFAWAYRFYSRYLRHVFNIDESKPTPAQAFQDNEDFVPSKKAVLWGHHFASIAGAAPIVGPAVAIIWGWLPALIWIIVGSIFVGAAHDFGALVVSMEHRGRSMAQVAGELLSPRIRNLFLVVILFLVWMVIAVFTLVIASLFIRFPSSVLPVHFQIVVALVIGYFLNKKGHSLLIPTLLAVAALIYTIHLGSLYPIEAPAFLGSPLMFWIALLLIYSFIASVLPVWALLQPRDYINSYQLLLGLACLVAGVFVLQPQIVAPVFQANPKGAPPWFPFLFITIACGAISGFHGLVSAGTTSKQVAQWKDARAIGYGAMLGEALLALLATLAVSAGFESPALWHQHYSSWGEAQGLTQAMGAFVLGSARFLQALGIPESSGQTMMSVVIISFAATSLDTATRIQRYIIGEIGELNNIPLLRSPVVGAGLAVASALFLMLLQEGGQGGLAIWPLFGANNQMLAALTLIVICAYLIKNKTPVRAFLIPLLAVLLITLLGLVFNIYQFLQEGSGMLAVLASTLLMIECWVAVEAWRLLYPTRDNNL